MDEDLKARLLKSLDQVGEWIDKGASFAADQAPQVCAEIVTLGRVEHTACLCLALLGLMASAALLALCLKCVRSDGLYDDAAFGYGLFSAITAVFGIGVTAGSLHEALTAWFAPRVYVLEWLAK